MQWCRLWRDFASDPKVQTMSESNQRRLIMLFCLNTDKTLESLTDDEISFSLRVSLDEWKTTKKEFVEKRFCNVSKNKIVLTNWNKRQFKSDDVSDRVKKFREKYSKVKRCGNVTETHQNRTEQNRTEQSIRGGLEATASQPTLPNNSPKKSNVATSHNVLKFEEFWKEYPKKLGIGSARKSWSKLKLDNGLFDKIMESLSVQKKSEQWIKDGGQFIPSPSTWINQERWDDELVTKKKERVVFSGRKGI